MNIDNMIQGNPQALVTSYNGVLVADSLEVADRFGKRHTHVLRSIDDLINQLESQSTQNWADYFIPDDYQDNKNRTQRRFKLTRDGFSLLVMGFTGPAALHWKLLYIEAFNKMEQALRSNVDIRQLVTQITTDVLRTVLPDIRQAVEPPEIEDGRVHNSRRLDFLYGNDEALPNFLTVYDIRDYLGMEDLKPDIKSYVVVHEVTHAVLFEANAGNYASKETFVEALAWQLLYFLQDNDLAILKPEGE